MPCQGECIAYPCNNWEEIVETELDVLPTILQSVVNGLRSAWRETLCWREA